MRWFDHRDGLRRALDRESCRSTDLFRKERLEEPLEDYLEAFDEYQGNVEELFETTIDLTELDERAVEFLTNPRLFVAFRYLAGPPISDDDLKTIAEVQSLNASQLRNDSEAVRSVINVVRMVLDRRRFPWVVDQREPTEAEKNAAMLASAALMATQRVGTARRSKGKTAKEGMVSGILIGAGLLKVATRMVSTIADAPEPGQFCDESYLGNRKADFIIRLLGQADHARGMQGVELGNQFRKTTQQRCRRESGSLAEGLRNAASCPGGRFGGVYKLHNLEDAQNRGLTLFWAHTSGL